MLRITGFHHFRSENRMSMSSRGTHGEFVTEKDRARRRNQLIGLQSAEDLTKSVLIKADLDCAPCEAMPVRCCPNRHRSIAFSDNRLQRNGRRLHWIGNLDG